MRIPPSHAAPGLRSPQSLLGNGYPGHPASGGLPPFLNARTLFVSLFAVLLGACQPAAERGGGRLRLSYWEKWTGAEAAAMQATVDAFNASQDRIQVNLVSMSQVDRKLLVATAGGDPPDIAGLWLNSIASFADRDALIPLDDFMRADGAEPDAWLARYTPVYANMGRHAGHTYALPTTGTAVALHWNKALFREAGLDPERPPRTLAEFENYIRRLTKRDSTTGALTQIGFLAQEPGWWLWAQPLWFGGRYFDDAGAVCIGRDPASLAGYVWLRRQTEEYGLEAIQRFTSGFGPFASSQQAFFAGKVAMVFQGVWLNNFARQYAPALDYGVARWPVVGNSPVTITEADVIVIPRGARHPKESWEFLRYLGTHRPDARTRAELGGIEILCFEQEKTSPLREWSPFFTHHHPHPKISFFRELEADPGAVHAPLSGVWQEYGRELSTASERVRLLDQTPESAVAEAQARMEIALARHQASLERQHHAASTSR